MDDTIRNQSAQLVATFRQAREIYRTAARLLRATEPSMSERGFRPYANWASVWPTLDAKLSSPDQWLRNWVIRQYFRPAFHNREVVTLGAILFDLENPRFRVPMLLGSRMAITTANGNEPYWVAQLQRWSDHGPDGEVRRLSVDQPGVTRVEEIRTVVAGGELLSVAIPLLEATDIGQVERRVIDPLLHEAWEMP